MPLIKTLYPLSSIALFCLLFKWPWLQAYSQTGVVHDLQQNTPKLSSTPSEIVLPKSLGGRKSFVEEKSTYVGLQESGVSNNILPITQVTGQRVTVDSVQSLFSVFTEANKLFNYHVIRLE